MNNLGGTSSSLPGITQRVSTAMTEDEISPVVENPDVVATTAEKEAHIVADEDVRPACCNISGFLPSTGRKYDDSPGFNYSAC